MSEVFDPEKVERWDCEASGNVVEASDGQYIRAEDYDKLLALYREHVPAVPCYVCGREAKGTKAKVKGTGEAVCMACYDSALDSN